MADELYEIGVTRCDLHNTLQDPGLADKLYIYCLHWLGNEPLGAVRIKIAQCQSIAEIEHRRCCIVHLRI